MAERTTTKTADYDITETMLRYGGGFVQALAKAYRLADDHNKQRIKDAFPDYWAQYAEIARKL